MEKRRLIMLALLCGLELIVGAALVLHTTATVRAWRGRAGSSESQAPGIALNNLLSATELPAGQQLRAVTTVLSGLTALEAEPAVTVTATPEATATPAPTSTEEPTATFTPTPTTEPTATTAPTPTTEPSPTPEAPPPLPEPPPENAPTVNGIERARVAVIPDEVLTRTREIFVQGQQLGRNPRAFSKLGDSVIMPPFFAPYDVGNYALGIYSDLQGVVDYFAGSYARDSACLRIGLHSWTAFDPVWADKSRCLANEGPLPCELRLHNPSILIVRIGSNDVGVPSLYESEMRRIVEYAIENGVIPVLGTKADRYEGSNQNNEIVRRLATEYQIPLWDFDLVAETVPGRGLDVDRVHLDGNGHFMQNVSGLVVLDRLWREVIAGQP